MYIARIGKTKLYDPRVDDLALIDPVVELEENSAGSFSFTITPNHPANDLLERRKTIIDIYEDDEPDPFFSCMVYEMEDDFFKNTKVYCEGELSYLNDSIQRPAEYHGMSVIQLLSTYINNHNAQVEQKKQFKLGIVTVHDPNDSIYCFTNMESTMECIKEDLVDDLGGILHVRHANGEKYIDYITEDDVRVNNQVIRLGENLINYKSNISSLNIATAVIPLGEKLEVSPIPALDMRLDIKSVNDDIDYVYDQDAVNAFGWVYKTAIWENVTTATALKRKGEEYLSNTQFDNLVIEATAIDLHLVDPAETSIRLSDKLRFYSKPHGLKNKFFRLTKQSIRLNNPANNIMTFGKEEHLSLSARTSQANAEAIRAMESITPASKILNLAKANASAMINGNGQNGFVVLHENDQGVVYEILIMDTPDINTAQKVWRWNQNGLGYSDKGYAPDNFKLAITADGQIVADFITSGIMSGSIVRGGDIEVGGTGFGASGSITMKDENGNVLLKLDKNGLTFFGNYKIQYANISGTPSIPSKTSELQNDSGFINSSALNPYQTKIDQYNVTTKTFTGASMVLGGQDDANGNLVVKNADGTKDLVTLDNEGIKLDNSVKITANNIEGGTLKLGGKDDANGKLQLVDASGNVLVEMTSTGFNVTGTGVIPWSAIGQHDGVVEGTYHEASYWQEGYTSVGQKLVCEDLTVTGGGIDLPNNKGTVKIYDPQSQFGNYTQMNDKGFFVGRTNGNFVSVKGTWDENYPLGVTVQTEIAQEGTRTINIGSYIKLESANGSCELTPTSLKFYNASGTLIKQYP